MKNVKQKYFQHISGITALFSWLQEKVPNIAIDKQMLYMPEVVCKRFCIGVPKKTFFGRNVFLAVPTKDLKWANNIIWNRAVVFPEKKKLFLVSQKMSENEMSVIPSFALGFSFDNPEKGQILSHLKKIGIKSYWKEGNTLHVDNSDRITIPLRRWDGLILESDEVVIDVSFGEIIKRKIEKTNVFSDPGYQGDKNILEKLDKGLLEQLASLLSSKKDDKKKDERKKDEKKLGEKRKDDNLL